MELEAARKIVNACPSIFSEVEGPGRVCLDGWFELEEIEALYQCMLSEKNVESLASSAASDCVQVRRQVPFNIEIFSGRQPGRSLFIEADLEPDCIHFQSRWNGRGYQGIRIGSEMLSDVLEFLSAAAGSEQANTSELVPRPPRVHGA